MTALYYLKSTAILGIFAIVCCTPFPNHQFRKMVYRRRRKPGQGLIITVYALLLLISTAYLVNATYNPFLYFRF